MEKITSAKYEEKQWQEYLMGLDKEVLVKILLSKLSRDQSFCKEVYYEYVKDIESVEDDIANYLKEAERERVNWVRCADDLLTISYDLYDRAQSSELLIDQVRLCLTIMKTLWDALNDGAGFEDGNDVYIGDIIDECERLLCNVIPEKISYASQDDIKTIKETIEKASKDSDLKNAIEKLRVRIDI